MKKYLLSILIAAVYVLTMLVPYYLTSVTHEIDAKNEWISLQYGVLHYPSLLYILAAAFLLHTSIYSDLSILFRSHKKMKKEMDEAISLLSLNGENYEPFIKSENEFSSDIKTVILHGGIEEDMDLVVEKRVLKIATMYEKLISEYGYIATILPMLGMLGTITGLLQMFAVSDGVDNIAQKMASLSIALATTLYATLWVILITKPKSREIELKLIDLTDKEHELIMNAKLFLHNADLNLLVEKNLETTVQENTEDDKENIDKELEDEKK